MLGFFRKLAGTWPARVFFIALAAAFVGWGVSGKVDLTGGNNVATVEGRAITPAQFQQEFDRDWRMVAARLPDPQQVPPGLRQEVMAQTLQRLVSQQSLVNEAQRMGVAVPDEAVRQAVYDIPAFHGVDGKFDRGVMLQALNTNSLTETGMLQSVRLDLLRNQLLQTVQASTAVPDQLTGIAFGFLGEKRVANVVALNFASVAPPAAPADAVLRRYFDNNPSRYTSPEYRRIKTLVLSPASIGRGLTIPDSELHNWFDLHRSEFVVPETRSLQVITAGTEAVASRLAAIWTGGADWTAMQAAASAVGATAATLDDSSAVGVPSPELARAAFAAALNKVTGPVQEPLGVQLVRVVKITPGKNPGFEALRATLHDRVGAEKAADVIDAKAQKLQDLFAGGGKIDEVPADLGAAGAEGTLDAQGNTPEGVPAPIPATGALRTQIVQQAFSTARGDPVQFTEAPDHSWFGVSVEAITKPAPQVFETIRARVLADWQRDQIRHAQETQAAKLLALVKSGQTLAAAAWGSGLQVTRTPPVPRDRPPAGVAAELAAQLFTLKLGEPTMVETDAGFVVATLAEIRRPDRTTDNAGFAQTRDALKKSLGEDMVISYATAVRDLAKPRVNEKLVQSLIQSPAE